MKVYYTTKDAKSASVRVGGLLKDASGGLLFIDPNGAILYTANPDCILAVLQD
jgi:hypothetical protein